MRMSPPAKPWARAARAVEIPAKDAPTIANVCMALCYMNATNGALRNDALHATCVTQATMRVKGPFK